MGNYAKGSTRRVTFKVPLQDRIVSQPRASGGLKRGRYEALDTVEYAGLRFGWLCLPDSVGYAGLHGAPQQGESGVLPI